VVLIIKGKDRGPATVNFQHAILIQDLVNDEMGLIEHQLHNTIQIMDQAEAAQVVIPELVEKLRAEPVAERLDT
jgi:hypothetical protein